MDSNNIEDKYYDIHKTKVSSSYPLIREKTRIFRPWEYKAIYRAIPKQYHKTQFDGLLFSGMRYIEMQRFQKNPRWFDGEFIHLPKEAQLKIVRVAKPKKGKKKKRRPKTHQNRDIILNPLGKKVIEYFVEVEESLPTRQTWKDNLRRWAVKGGVDPSNINIKSTRKTWCSWLLSNYGGEKLTEICLSMGHDSVTSINHYLNVGFTSEDKQEIKKLTEGWI